jgi:hypothetical protein
LHNIVIKVEHGDQQVEDSALSIHTHEHKIEDHGQQDEPLVGGDNDEGEAKWRRLVEELVAFQQM